MAIEDLYEALRSEYEAQRKKNRVSEQQLDGQKQAPSVEALVLASSASGDDPSMRLPVVRPYDNGRIARKEAEEEQRRQWHIIQETKRTALAVNSVVVVNVHAQRQLNMGVDAMSNVYFGEKRPETMNQLMGKLTGMCLKHMEAGVGSVLESHPKRIGENL